MLISEKCSEIYFAFSHFIKKPVFESISGFIAQTNAFQLVGGWISYTQTALNFSVTSQMPNPFIKVESKYVYGNRMPANTASMSDVPVALSVSSLISQNMAPPSAC